MQTLVSNVFMYACNFIGIVSDHIILFILMLITVQLLMNYFIYYFSIFIYGCAFMGCTS